MFMNALSNAFYAAANYVHKLLIVVTKRVKILWWWMARARGGAEIYVLN